MGNLRLVVAILFVAACGSDHANTPDAHVTHDAPSIDAKVFMDAPPPTYDFSCYGMTPGTTVDATITLAGNTGELSQNGLMGVGGLQVTAYKVGSNTAAATVISSIVAGSEGDFTTGPIASNGTALEHLKALDVSATPTYRTTFLYPPYPLRASLNGIPVPLIKSSTFSTLTLAASVNQDDANNGVLVVAVSDCNVQMPTGINGATLKVQQNNADVGQVFDLGALFPQAAGTFFVFNVPDGNTDVSASFNGMTFPTHTVVAHKKPGGNGQVGTITATAVTPGPIY